MWCYSTSPLLSIHCHVLRVGSQTVAISPHLFCPSSLHPLPRVTCGQSDRGYFSTPVLSLFSPSTATCYVWAVRPWLFLHTCFVPLLSIHCHVLRVGSQTVAISPHLFCPSSLHPLPTCCVWAVRPWLFLHTCFVPLLSIHCHVLRVGSQTVAISPHLFCPSSLHPLPRVTCGQSDRGYFSTPVLSLFSPSTAYVLRVGSQTVAISPYLFCPFPLHAALRVLP